MEKIETDNGWLININKDTIGFDIKHIYVGTIAVGKDRGHHYHKKAFERFICLKGIISVQTKIVGGQEDFFDLESGDYVDIKPGLIHTLMNLSEEDVYFIGVVSEEFDKEGKDTFEVKE